MYTAGDEDSWHKLSNAVQQKKRKLDDAQEEYNSAVNQFDAHPTTKRQKREEAERKSKQDRATASAAREDARDRQINHWWTLVSKERDPEANSWLLEADALLQGPIEFEESYTDIAYGMGAMETIATYSCNVPVASHSDADPEEKTEAQTPEETQQGEQEQEETPLAKKESLEEADNVEKEEEEDEEEDEFEETEEWSVTVKRDNFGVYEVTVVCEDDGLEYGLDRPTLSDVKSKNISWNQLLAKYPDKECHWAFFIMRFDTLISEWGESE